MTQEQFDSYKFGIKTIILFDDYWWFVDSVDFGDRTICPKGYGEWVSIDRIKDIKD